jgi:hypothetical protein
MTNTKKQLNKKSLLLKKFNTSTEFAAVDNWTKELFEPCL